MPRILQLSTNVVVKQVQNPITAGNLQTDGDARRSVAGVCGGESGSVTPDDEQQLVLPGQTQMVILSIVFVLASVFLFLQFLLIYHAGVGSPIAVGSLWWDGCPADCPPSASHWINSLGVLNCIGWVVGFAMLLDWNVNSLSPPHGRVGLTGVCLKLIAAVLFTIQPWSNLIDSDSGVAGLGVVWSNFAGICFFHSGNCISAWDMRVMMDWSRPLSKNNWPVLGMWVFMVATWFLSIADGMAYFNLRCGLLSAVPTLSALGVSDPDSWVCKNVVASFITPGQLIGAGLLAVGSCMYVGWAV
jgi:hypothetical protein